MTPRVSAELLTAILGSSQINESAATVRRYNKAALIWPERKYHPFQIGTPAINSLPPDHTFIDALTALIVSAGDGTLVPELGQDDLWNNLTIHLFYPGTDASISIIRPDSVGGVRYAGPLARGQVIGDMVVQRQAKLKTLLYIGKLLVGKLDDLPPLKTARSES